MAFCIKPRPLLIHSARIILLDVEIFYSRYGSLYQWYTFSLASSLGNFLSTN